jgi:hypothetical protein
MAVEICLHEQKFSGFPKNEWVYDDLQISQPGVQRGRADGQVPTLRFGGCPYSQASGRKMRKNQRRFLWLGISILGLLTSSPALLGQASPGSEAAVPVLSDWSDHHLIFSKPATAEQTQRVQRDPRYWRQQSRQSQRLREAPGALAPESRFGSRLAVSGHGHRRHGGNQGINKDWSEDLGTAATLGATNFPAKVSFKETNATCAGGATQPDFVVYPTGLKGSGTQADIAAFDNLYSGCSADGTVPTVFWGYNTLGKVTTSPALSSDGTQVAFVETNSSVDGVLVLLKWAAASGTIGSPITLSQQRPNHYPTCTAPCMTNAILTDSSGTAHADTNSSVFYDFSDDTAYVGDDGGWLHQFHPVFNGTPSTPPAEVRTGGWPVQVNPGAATALTSPVFDATSGLVFVADVGGFLYRVSPNTAAVTTSGQLDFSSSEGGVGIVQGPIVDSTAELVYVFASSDGSGSCTSAADCTGVYQLAANFADGDTGSEAIIGNSTVFPSAPSPVYIGALDSTYENSVNATGHLYVCGNTGGAPTLYQVTIGAGVLGTVTPGPVLASGTTPCSSVTDIFNPNAPGGATEWMFASVQNKGVSSGCASGGCIFNFKNTSWLPLTVYTVGQEVLDTNLHIQVVATAGTSGASTPLWNNVTGGSTTDGTVHWLDQGALSAATLPVWVKSNSYTKGTEILDSNNNVEIVTTAGTSGTPNPPPWNTTAGGTTTDGTVTWTNLGALATADMPVSGGTSGIIVDNTVGSGTLAGVSQVYFSTLGSQVCGASGTGGCAVQASQSALH